MATIVTAAQQQPLPTPSRSVARYAIIAAFVIAGFFVLRRIPMTLEVLVVATLLSIGVNPIVQALSKRVSRLAAIALVFTAFIVVMLAIALIVIPAVVGQLQTLFAHSGDYITPAQAWLAHAREWINRKLGGHLAPSQMTALSGQGLGGAWTLLQSAFGQLGFALVSTVDTLVVVFTAIVLSYYFLTNAAAMKASFLSFFPQRSQADALRFTQEVERVVGGYISGQIILCAFCGVCTFLALAVLHVDYALLVGVLTGLLYAIPYLGVTSAILLGSLFGLLQSWELAVGSAVVIFVVTRISDTLLVPKVMSKTVGVSPAGIMLAVFAGGELFGLWGLLLAIPGAALFKVVWTIWLQPWLIGKPQTPSQSAFSGGQSDAS